MPPRRFIITVMALFALLHFYIGLRILPSLPVASGWRAFGALLLIFSWLLIPAGLLSRSFERPPLSNLLAWSGLLAMGMFSTLLLLTLLRDIGLLVVMLFGIHDGGPFVWSAVAVPSLAVLITLIGLMNARRTARVADVEVPISGLPKALDGFTIAQISDIHVGPTIRRGYVEAIVDAVNGLEADMVAVTGDLVDGSVEKLRPHTAPLAKLKARHGTYFVTGNHEYYSNAPEWIAEVKRLGMKVLLNEHAVLEHRGASVLIAGVTDYSAHHFDPAHRSDPHRAISGAPPEVSAKIVLAHQPRTAPAAAEAGFDLQLSGHTHGGQFFPWNLFVPLQQPYTAGLHRLGKMWVYTSRGTGYWGPPKRFGAPSEITRIKLVSPEN